MANSYLLGESMQLGVGVENTGVNRGVAVAPQAWIPARTPSGIRPVVDKVLVAETRASRFTSQGSEIVQKRVEGDLEFNLRVKSVGFLLKSLFGSVVTALASGETTVWEHTFDVLLNNPQNPSLTMAMSRPDSGFQDYKYNLALVSAMEFNLPVDDLANVTAEFVAKDETENADYVPGSEDTEDYYFRNHDCTIKIASNVAGLGAATALAVKEFSFSPINNARPNQNISDYNPSDVLALLMEVTGSFVADYRDESLHDIYVNGSYVAMQIEMKRDDVTIGNAENPTVRFTFPRVSFENLEQDRPIDDIVTDGVDFTAHYDDTEGYGIRAVLVNEQEDYDPASGS